MMNEEPAGAGPWKSSGGGRGGVPDEYRERPPPDSVAPDYRGGRKKLFFLALGRMILTILTLGVGRFWMVTRLRRFYWSSIHLDGAPLEYTGRPLEKLVGFLVAVVILAVYLLAVNIGLAFIGLSVFQGYGAALQLPLLAALPLWFWARYRARRYILARTRWRGIRFGMEPGAWGYALRATALWLATILTLGGLYPLLQWRLSRYVTDRSAYGDLAFAQGGRVGPLFGSWMWVWAPVPLALIVAVVAAASGGETGDGGVIAGQLDRASDSPGVVALAAFVALLMGLSLVRHKVFSFRYLVSNRTLGERTSFTSTLGFPSVLAIYIVGYLVIGIVVTVTVVMSLGLGLGSLAAAGLTSDSLAELSEGGTYHLSGLIGLGVAALAYLPAVAVYVALGHAFISHPLLREASMTLRVRDLEAAGRARQRAHDEQAEAGGFADALGSDVGGAV